MRLWKLPFESRQINDREPEPKVQGPSCVVCAAYQARQLACAEKAPMLSSPYGGRKYRSPHYSTYLFEVRYSRWSCLQGVHGALKSF